MISNEYEILQTNASKTLWHFSSSYNALDILYIPRIFYEDRLFLPFASIQPRVSISRPAKTCSRRIHSLREFLPLDMPFSKMFELAIDQSQLISISGHRDYRDRNSTVKKRRSRDGESLRRRREETK